jgi:hypothetical protein
VPPTTTGRHLDPTADATCIRPTVDCILKIKFYAIAIGQPRLFDVIAAFGLRELLTFDDCVAQLFGVQSLVRIARLAHDYAELVVANLAVARLNYGIQLGLVLSLSTHAGGVPGLGLRVMETARGLLVEFQAVRDPSSAFNPTEQAYEFLAHLMPIGQFEYWDQIRWSAAKALADLVSIKVAASYPDVP